MTHFVPLTPKDLFEIETVGDPNLSPDGRWIAYVRQSVDRAENTYRSAIWLTDGTVHKQFTAGTHRDHTPRWSPDGRMLAFVSTRNGKPQIYVIPVDGGEARQLTRMENGATAPAWSPDGTRIAFNSSVDADERAFEDGGAAPPEDPEQRKLWKQERERQREKQNDPRLITRFPYRTGTEFLEERYPHIYVIGLDEDKPHRVTDGDRMWGTPVWDGNEAILTAVNRDSTNLGYEFPSDIVRIPLRQGEIVPPEVLVGAPGTHHRPHPSPDGRWIAYLTTPEVRVSAQNTDLAIIPAQGGEPRLLTAALDVKVADFKWAADGQSLYLTWGWHGDVGIHRLTLDGQVTQVVGGARTVTGLDLAADRLAYTVTAPDIPGDLYVADLNGQKERRLTGVNAEFLAGRWLSMPQEVWYTRPDGTPIQGWLMLPPNYEPGKRYPLAVEIHGGPHLMWGNTFWHEFQCLAGAGYAVWFCNPRGSDGYGLAFRDAIHRQWGEEDAGDILAGVDELVRRGIADPARLAVTGGSYGGFMTVWIIGHDRRFKAAVTQRGVYNLISFYGMTDIPLFIEGEFDTTPWEDANTLWQHSPLAYVEQIETPLLILHSERDFRVPIGDGEQLYTALKRLRREVAFVRYPREGHELSRSGEPQHRVDRLERIIGWFDRYIKEKNGTNG